MGFARNQIVTSSCLLLTMTRGSAAHSTIEMIRCTTTGSFRGTSASDFAVSNRLAHYYLGGLKTDGWGFARNQIVTSSCLLLMMTRGSAAHSTIEMIRCTTTGSLRGTSESDFAVSNRFAHYYWEYEKLKDLGFARNQNTTSSCLLLMMTRGSAAHSTIEMIRYTTTGSFRGTSESDFATDNRLAHYYLGGLNGKVGDLREIRSSSRRASSSR